MNLKNHWDSVYLDSPDNQLGWYETDLSPMLKLLLKTDINKSSRILNVGAGSTTLVDELLKKGYSNIIATDISEIALKKLENRVGNDAVEFIVDDLMNPTQLKTIEQVDIWIDRAVLHFFTKEVEQKMYFDLLKSLVTVNGFVVLAEFNLNGAERCSGLPVHRYSQEMLDEKLGNDFDLIDCFNHTYLTPSGAERPYIYSLYERIN